MDEASAVVDPVSRTEVRTSVARNAFHLILGQAASTILAIVFSAALGRTLGASDFGLYFLISSFATFAYVVVDWGQLFYLIREVARAPQRTPVLVGSTFVLRLAGGFLATLPSGLIAWALGYNSRTSWFTVAFMLATLPFVVAQVYCFAFRGSDRMDLDATTTVLNKVIGLALGLAALAIGTGLGGVVVTQFIAGVIALAFARRLFRKISASRIRFDKVTAREVLVGGTGIVGMMIAVQVQPYLDAIILSKLVPGDAVGWYGAAKNMMGTLIAPALIVGAAVYPRLSRTASSIPVFRAEFQATLRPTLWLGALGAVGTYVFADAAIALIYGHRHFAPAGLILRIFGPGILLLFVDVLLGNALTALGKAGLFSIVKVVSIAVSTGLDLFLVPYFQRRLGNGGVGVVVSFLLSEFVVFAGAIRLMPHGSVGRGVLLDVLRALGSLAMTTLLFTAVPPLPLFIGIPVCVAAFTLASLATGLLRRDDVELLVAVARKRDVVGPAPAGSNSVAG